MSYLVLANYLNSRPDTNSQDIPDFSVHISIRHYCYLEMMLERRRSTDSQASDLFSPTDATESHSSPSDPSPAGPTSPIIKLNETPPRRALPSPGASTSGLLRFSTPTQSNQISPESAGGQSSQASSSTRDSLQEPVSPLSSFTPYYHSRSARSSAVRMAPPRRMLSTQSVLTLRKPYPSTRLTREIEKPWLKHPDPAHRWAKIIFWGLFGLSFAVAGASKNIRYIKCVQQLKLCQSYTSVSAQYRLLARCELKSICHPGSSSHLAHHQPRCLVMEDDFSNGINADYWTHEVRLDGYGNHEFEWTTANANNSYVEDGILYIVPTLTSDTLGTDAITNGYTLNLTTDGTCTSSDVLECAAVSNSTSGSIINPVQSARLTTQGKISVKYGKVEVTARMPVG